MIETSIERVIRQKLNTALNEEKKRVAGTLLEVVIAPMPSAGGKPEGKPDQAAALTAKRQAKSEQISAMRQRISGLQSKSASAKDPAAMREQLQALNAKLSVMQQELASIK